ncbi:MAG: cellulose binding domain-containing protein [Ruminococcus flavefaciens]|nr:cellulose binding domain-containing protein [Ruminococcus flavefaciens]
MLNIKKATSFIVGSVLSANILLTLPTSAFAAEDTIHTFVFDDYTIEYEVKGSWANMEQVSVTLVNTGDVTIENWMLYFDPNGQVSNIVNAKDSLTSAGTVYFKNSGYNANVAPRSSVSFSYMVDNCKEIPDNFTLCQSRTEKEDGYNVSLIYGQNWGDSFNGSIMIENTTAEPIEMWELTIDTNFTISEITNSWAADVNELESCSYLLKGTYTSCIPANSYVELGFIGVMNGTPVISEYYLTEVTVNENIIATAELWEKFKDWDNMTDTDSDGLPDEFETEIGTDPFNADTDNDDLPDGYELFTLNSDPMNMYHFDAEITDGQYDCDQDGLSNYQEYLIGTDPFNTDSDFDNISDGDEVNIYGTDPMNPDTDEDTIWDGDEIALGLNPLLSDSYNDGINDSDRKFMQTIGYTESDDSLAVKNVSISFEGTGYINSTTNIETDDTNVFVSNLVGIIGKPFKFESASDFDEAEVSFQIDKADADVDDIRRLGVVWFDETFHQFRLLECNYDIATSVISVTVPHFSVYCVVNKEEWMSFQGNCYFIASDDLTDDDNDGIPDYYESTNKENPEHTYILSNGTTSFSLKGEAHSDKQLTRDTMYDVVTIKENGVTYYTDGIPDGEEMVFCTAGDVNCDKVVNAEDVDLLQSYVSGKAVLTAIGTVNADCNLDGKINADDIELINNFIENGYNNGVLSGILGDINRDGVVSAIDLNILADFLLGQAVLYPVTLDVADFTNDEIVDSFDLILMRQYLLHHSQSIAGFSYFYCVSDPMTNDSDGDLDWDQADPDPMSYQLNG